MTRMLKKALENILSDEDAKDLVSAFDQIGDIIIVRIPDSLISKKKIIGKALLEQVNTAKQYFINLLLLKVTFVPETWN